MSIHKFLTARRGIPVRTLPVVCALPRVRVLVACAVCLTALRSPLLAADLPQPQLSPQQLAQRVDRYYNQLHSLRADFTESYQGMGVRRDESGTLLLLKPGKMRWNYAKPAGKLFILDGKDGWFYTPGDAHAEHIAAKDVDDLRSPLRFLLGRTHLEKEFQDLSLSSGDDGLKLSGIPKGMGDRIARITLGVAPDGAIQSILMAESDGTRTAFTFTNNQPNAPAPPSDFVFHPPAGVPVVDGLPPI